MAEPTHRISVVDPETRTGACSTCGEVKLKRRNLKNGAVRWTCMVSELKWRQTPEERRARRKQMTPEERERHLESTRQRKRDRAPEYRQQRAREQLARYSMTAEQYDAMVRDQLGRCSICALPMPNPHIDHDHDCCSKRNSSCGSCVRGLLCRSCNVGLGFFGDDRDRLVRAADYLAS